MKINFGSQIFESEAPVTVYDAAKEVFGNVERSVIAASVNGETVALSYEIGADADVKLLTFADKEGAHVFRHTASHILAQAVKRLYPNAKCAIGPAVDSGFYYDFDSEVSFTPEILEKIEAEMKKIVKENLKIRRFELPRSEALALMTEKNEPADSILVNVVVDDESETDNLFSIVYCNKTTWEDMDLSFMVDLANSISAEPFTVGDLKRFLKDNTQKYYREGSKYKYKHLDFFENYGYQYLSEETIRHDQPEDSEYQDGVITPPELTIFGLIRE